MVGFMFVSFQHPKRRPVWGHPGRIDNFLLDGRKWDWWNDWVWIHGNPMSKLLVDFGVLRETGSLGKNALPDPSRFLGHMNDHPTVGGLFTGF